MKANPPRPVSHGSAIAKSTAAGQRSRGAYRQSTDGGPSGRPGHRRLKPERAAALILEVLAGVRTPAGAATALGIRLPRCYLLEQRAIQGLISACEPRPVGRTVSTDRRLAQFRARAGCQPA